jgi:hypothetical protein
MFLYVFVGKEYLIFIVNESRSFGSVPWLFPIGRDYHFNVRERDSKDYKPRSVKYLMQEAGAENSWKFFQEYYLSNPLYLRCEKEDIDLENEEEYYCNLPPALRPPLLPRLVIINGILSFESISSHPFLYLTPISNINIYIIGVNVDTEVNYFFRKEQNTLAVDVEGEDFDVNGLKTKNGIVNETKDTPQKLFSRDGKPKIVHRSGDGTVPYFSLSYYVSLFEKLKQYPHPYGPLPELEVVEIPGAAHREILSHDDTLDVVLDVLSGHPIHASKKANFN